MSDQTIYFITGSKHKITEANRIVDFPIKQLKLDLPEIQSLDPVEVVEAKLKQARVVSDKELIMVEDVSLDVHALNGFPGPLIKFVEEALGDSGVYDLVKGFDTDDYSVTVRATIGFAEGDKHSFFEGSFTGALVEHRGTIGWGFSNVVVPDGYDKTMAQLDHSVRDKISHRYKALKQLSDYLKKS